MPETAIKHPITRADEYGRDQRAMGVVTIAASRRSLSST
jgi:hypothetical protein